MRPALLFLAVATAVLQIQPTLSAHVTEQELLDLWYPGAQNQSDYRGSFVYQAANASNQTGQIIVHDDFALFNGGIGVLGIYVTGPGFNAINDARKFCRVKKATEPKTVDGTFKCLHYSFYAVALHAFGFIAAGAPGHVAAWIWNDFAAETNERDELRRSIGRRSQCPTAKDFVPKDVTFAGDGGMKFSCKKACTRPSAEAVKEAAAILEASDITASMQSKNAGGFHFTVYKVVDGKRVTAYGHCVAYAQIDHPNVCPAEIPQPVNCS